jgi:hypothetical protein
LVAPLYQSSAPLYDGTGVSGATPIAASPGAPTRPALTGKRVNVVAPNGETISLDMAELPLAESRGFKIEGAEAAGLRRYVAENKGLSGDVKVALRGLLDEATFGIADPVIDANRDPFEVAKFGALKADHTVADLAGRAGGFGLSMLYGGEVFGTASHAGSTAARLLGREAIEHAAGKALTAELAYRAPALAAKEAAHVGSGAAARVLQSMADHGTQGLVLSSPRAMAQMLTGDPDKAGETWLYGAAGGAAIGAIAGGVGAIVGGTASKVAAEGASEATPSALKGLAKKEAEKQAFRSMASNHASLKKGAKVVEHMENGQLETGRYALDKGLTRGFREGVPEHAERIGANLTAEGEALGLIRKNLDDLAREANEANGMSVKELTGIIRKEVINPLKSKPGYESVVAKIESYTDSFSEKAAAGGAVGFSKDKITFSRLHEVQQALDDIAYRNSGANPAEHIKELREIRRILNNYTLEKGEAFAQKHGQQFAEPLKQANRNYQYALALDAITSDFSKVRELTVRNFSPTDYLTGASSMLTGMVGGGIPGAIAGAGAAYAHKVLREEGNAFAARALDGWSRGRGLVALEGAHASVGKELDRIAPALEALATRSTLDPRVRTMPTNIVTHILGLDAVSGHDDAALMGLADRLASLSTDPTKVQRKIAEAVEPIHRDAPTVAMAASAKAAATVAYLHDKAPKPPVPASPFEPPVQWKPNATQRKDFKTRVATALDPFIAIDALGDGTLTQAHIETLQALTPSLFAEMRNRIASYAASGNAKPLPYAERLRLSMLTGAPLDRSLAQVAGYQQAFAAPAAARPHAPGKLKAPEVSDVARITG